MHKVTIEMPEVAQCDVSQCGYNVSLKCHARAITIGDSSMPACDTFFDSRQQTKAILRNAGVGACKVANCKFNEDFECMTDTINVGKSDQDIRCLTYAQRS